MTTRNPNPLWRRTSRWRNGLLGIAAALFMAPAANAQVNYSFNFDANSTGWTGNFSRYTGATACGGAGGAMRRNVYTATVGTLVSPTTGTAAGGLVTITYDYKINLWSANTSPTPTPWGSFAVEYGPTATGPWTNIATVTDETQSSACISKLHTFTPPAGALFVRWATAWTGGDSYWNFDNVVLTEAVAPCTGMPNPGSIPSPVTVCAGNVTTLTATGLTSDLAPGISYQWEESPDGIGSWASVVGGSGATTASYTTTPITATRYFRIVTTCSTGPDVNNSNVVTVNADPGSFAEDFSSGGVNNNCWTNSGTGTPTNLRYNAASAYGAGTGSIMWDFYSQNGLTLIYTSPLLTPIGAGQQLEFDVAGPQYDASSIDSIYIEESNNGGSTWTLVVAGSNEVGSVFNTLAATTTEYNTPGSGDWQARAFVLTAGTDRVRFRAVSGYGNNVFVDNIALGAAPACLAPITLSATSVTTAGADLGWTEQGSATAWDLEIGAGGFSATGIPTHNDVGANPYTWAGGAADTNYDFYVRADCGMDNVNVSAWTGPFSFFTGYCTPAPTSVDNQGIVRVVFSSVDNNTVGTSPEAGNYANFSAMVGDIAQSTTVNVDT
jgi:hypothetical protein